jgi:hypothetical protein
MISGTSCVTCDAAAASAATSPVTISFLIIFVVFLVFDALTNLRALTMALKQGGVLNHEANLLLSQKRGMQNTAALLRTGVDFSLLNARGL